MSERVLLVDDDTNVLQGFRRHLHRTYDLTLALGAREAIEFLAEPEPFAVIVSDMQMPDISGVELLAMVPKYNPHTVRVMLTGNADQKTAVDAVNEGRIFRFLSKPCPPDQLSGTLDAAIEHYRLITAEAELLGQTLAGSVRMLTQVLSMAMPTAFGLTGQARLLAREIAQRTGCEPLWQIEMAAMLMRIGCVSLPGDVIERYLLGKPLDADEASLVQQTPKLGHDLISAIPRLRPVAECIAKQFDAPEDPTPLASRILLAVGDFQRFSAATSPAKAIENMIAKPKYDGRVVGELAGLIESMSQSTQVDVIDLRPGMVLEESIVDSLGRVLVAQGIEIHDSLIHKLAMLRRSGTGVREPIRVRQLGDLKTWLPDAVPA